MKQTKFSVSASFDRTTFAANGSTEFYLNVGVKALNSSVFSDPTTRNIAIAFDAGATMQSHNKANLVLEAVEGLVRSLPDNYCLSLIAFSDKAKVLIDGQQVRNLNTYGMGRLMQQEHVGRSSNLSDGWFTAIRSASNANTYMFFEPNASENLQVILLTDGLGLSGITNAEELFDHATELRKRGVRTSTFAVGSECNEELLLGLADCGGGYMYEIDDPNDAKTAILSELGGEHTVLCEATHIRVQSSFGNAMHVVGQEDPPYSPHAVDIAAKLLKHRQVRSFAIKVTPFSFDIAGPLNFEISARGFCALTGAELTAHKTVSLPVSCGKSKPLSKPALRVARKKISYISYHILDVRRHCFGKDRLHMAQQEFSELCAYAEGAGCYGMIEDDLKKLEKRMAKLDASPNDVGRRHLALVQR